LTNTERRRREAAEGLRQELRRGTLVLAVLASFRREQFVAEGLLRLNEAGVEIDPGPLYPMLRRLEDQGFLESERRSEGGRLKRFYRTSAAGLEALNALTAELDALTSALKSLKDPTHDAA